MRPVCVSCSCEMRAEKNDRRVLLHYDPPDGGPYQMWSGDEYRCPRCHVRIVTAFGSAPVTEKYRSGFDADVELEESAGNLRHIHRNPVGGELLLTQDVIEAIRPVLEQRHANLVVEAKLAAIDAVQARIEKELHKRFGGGAIEQEIIKRFDGGEHPRSSLDAGATPADNEAQE